MRRGIGREPSPPPVVISIGKARIDLSFCHGCGNPFDRAEEARRETNLPKVISTFKPQDVISWDIEVKEMDVEGGEEEEVKEIDVEVKEKITSAGDVIEVRTKSKQLVTVIEATQLAERDVPEYIEADHSKMVATYSRVPGLTDVPYPVVMEPNLVVEFYSR